MQKGMAYVMLGRSERLEDLFIAGELDVAQIKLSHINLKKSRENYLKLRFRIALSEVASLLLK